MRVARPFVLVNMAMTADGKIATANRRVSSFGSPRDHAHLYELRATADAVMCGARTVSAAGVYLDGGSGRFQRQRLAHGLPEHPLRVIVSGSGSLSPRAAVFTRRCSPIVVLTTRRMSNRRQAALAKLADEVKICGPKRLDFKRALAWLAEHWQVKRLLVEGGGELNSELFAAGLVDELHLTLCPWIFAGRQSPTIADGANPASLAKAAHFAMVSCRQHGGELFLVYRRRA